MTLPDVNIFSDGGANPNPGPGAYGVIMEYRWVKKEFSQGYKKTTNNRMELMWVITGLSNLKTSSKVTVITDSQYTINGITKGWAKSWQKNGWKKADKKPATNSDLWEKLLDLLEKHEVDFFWVKWHNGHDENERCDELATLAMNKKNLLDDEGYKEVTSVKQNPNQSVMIESNHEKLDIQCKKCGAGLVKKYPKHTKKTLEKQYFYEYYHHCESCMTNYMLPEAKRNIAELKL